MIAAERQERSRPLLDGFHAWLEAEAPKVVTITPARSQAVLFTSRSNSEPIPEVLTNPYSHNPWYKKRGRPIAVLTKRLASFPLARGFLGQN